MSLSPLHLSALLTAVASSGIALTDAVVHGLTRGYSPFSDTSDLTAVVVVGEIVHGLAYAALAAVLVREAPRFASTHVVARVARRVVLSSLVALSAGFLLVAPVVELRDAYDTALYTGFGLLGGVGFAGLLLGSAVLGVALLRSGLGLGARLLALLLPTLAVTAVTGWLSPTWAHPAYAETVTYLGLALLGVRAASPQPGPRTAVADASA